MSGEYNKRQMNVDPSSMYGIVGNARKYIEKRSSTQLSLLPTGYGLLTTHHNFYAAAECARPALRTAAARIPCVSYVGQISDAPAANAAVHISSSARRCVQTTLSPGNS